MKHFTYIIALFCLVFSTGSMANDAVVTVRINKQTYLFDRPIRLASALSIVADNGDWYWPAAASGLC